MSTPSPLSIGNLCKSTQPDSQRDGDRTLPAPRPTHSRSNSDTSSLPSLSNESTTQNTPLSTPTATEFAYDRFSSNQPASSSSSSTSWMNSAYKAYEQSRMMRYVESGVRSLAVPIYGRIGKSFRDEKPVDKIHMQLRDKKPIEMNDEEDITITKAMANTSLESNSNSNGNTKRRSYRHSRQLSDSGNKSGE
ncbi:hypothetical protein Unana1_01442 [Umbelopsis nana]